MDRLNILKNKIRLSEVTGKKGVVPGLAGGCWRWYECMTGWREGCV